MSKIKNPQKIIMLDHDDLYTNLLKHNESPEKFSYYINNLSKFCKENNIEMLRTIGIIFASETRDVTGYTK
jgi:predicted CopG family antitoxin